MRERFAEAGFDRGAIILGDFPLVGGDIIGVGLIDNHGQCVDIRVRRSGPVLVDGEADSAPNFLALARFGNRLVERADLKNVGIVPALAQGGMGENKLDLPFGARFLVVAGAGESQKRFFVAHNQVELRRVFFRVAAFGGGEVGGGDRDGGQVFPFGDARAGAVEFLGEKAANDSVVVAEVGDAIDEKQRQRFDALRPVAFAGAQMLFDCGADLRAHCRFAASGGVGIDRQIGNDVRARATESDGGRMGANVVDNKAVVLRQFGEIAQTLAALQIEFGVVDLAVGVAPLQFDFGFVAAVDGKKAHRGQRLIFERDGVDGDFFHQPLAVGVGGA